MPTMRPHGGGGAAMTLESLVLTSAGRLRTWSRLVLFALAALAANTLVAPLLASLTPAVLASALSQTWRMVAVLGATWLLVHRVETGGWGIAGLDRAAWAPRRMLLGAALGAGAIALPVGLLLVTGQATFAAAPLGRPVEDLVLSVLVLAPAALTEELYLRGYPFSALRDGLGWPAATAITSVVFGLLHLGNPGASVQAITLVTAAGVFLALVRVATGSLAAAWAAHFAWNWTLAAGFHAPVSGLPFGTPGYRLQETGPDWLTGGVWGPEAGAVAGIGMSAAVAVLARFTISARHAAGREDTSA